MCVSVNDPFVYTPFSIRSMLYEIKTIHINFETFEEYLQELEFEEMDRQNKCINTFQL